MAERIFLGIDEAGRGSVIGPLVMGAVSVDQSTLDYYSTTEITDSKQLSPEKREKLFKTIQETSFTHFTEFLEPIEIDKAVLSQTSNLNILELQTMTNLILKNPASTDIFIDAISKPDYCTSNLKTLLKKDKTITVVKKVNEEILEISRVIDSVTKPIILTAQNKADVNFKVVSAASIIAKVTRDQAIRKIETEFSLEHGILASGYPNEQLKPFLQKYKKDIKQKEFPFIRYSWDWAPLKAIVSAEKYRQAKLL